MTATQPVTRGRPRSVRPVQRDDGRRSRRLIERFDDHVVVRIGSAPGSSATTFGPIVFLRPNRRLTPRLHRHEYEHVLQYAELGVVRFLVRYVGEYLRLRLRRYNHDAAYRRISFEIRAEWRARRDTGRGVVETPGLPRRSWTPTERASAGADR